MMYKLEENEQVDSWSLGLSLVSTIYFEIAISQDSIGVPTW